MNRQDKTGTRGVRIARILGALGLIGLLVGAGCGNKGQNIPDPGPIPSGADYAGVWYSPQFEHMYLRQTGNKVEGVYTYESGGTLEGTVDGNLLRFSWNDPGSKETATRTMEGHGYFRMVKEDDVLRLKGEWGYDEQYTGAGPWNAEYVRELESGDPMRLKDLEDHSESAP